MGKYELIWKGRVLIQEVQKILRNTGHTQITATTIIFY